MQKPYLLILAISRIVCHSIIEALLISVIYPVASCFSNFFPRLFSVTNLSKIWNEARVYELPSPGMEDITLQWLPNPPPRPFLPP